METGVRFGRVGERSLSIRHSRNQRGRSSVVQTSFPRCSPWGTGELERGPIGALLQHGCWRNSCPVGVQRHAIEGRGAIRACTKSREYPRRSNALQTEDLRTAQTATRGSRLAVCPRNSPRCSERGSGSRRRSCHRSASSARPALFSSGRSMMASFPVIHAPIDIILISQDGRGNFWPINILFP